MARKFQIRRGLKKNLPTMAQGEFVMTTDAGAEGLFIGSGVVESGCKTVLGARLKQSGMFWSLKGAKGMIPLRTLEKSGRLDEFFNWRLRNLKQVICTKVA